MTYIYYIHVCCETTLLHKHYATIKVYNLIKDCNSLFTLILVEPTVRSEIKSYKHFSSLSDMTFVEKVICVLLKHPLIPVVCVGL